MHSSKASFQGDHVRPHFPRGAVNLALTPAAENIMTALSEVSVSRHEGHEEIRVLSHQAAAAVKMEGKGNDFIDRIRRTESFKPINGRLDELLEPKNIYGRASQQVDKFTGPWGEVESALEKYEVVVRQGSR